MPRVKKKAKSDERNIQPGTFAHDGLSHSLAALGWARPTPPTFSFCSVFAVGDDESRQIQVVLKPDCAWKYHDNPRKSADVDDFFWWVESTGCKREKYYSNINDFGISIDGLKMKPLVGWRAEKSHLIGNEAITWALTDWARRRAWL